MTQNWTKPVNVRAKHSKQQNPTSKQPNTSNTKGSKGSKETTNKETNNEAICSNSMRKHREDTLRDKSVLCSLQ